MSNEQRYREIITSLEAEISSLKQELQTVRDMFAAESKTVVKLSARKVRHNVADTVIHGFKGMLQSKGISYRTLEQKSGISQYTIHKATAEKPISKFMAQTLLDAVVALPSNPDCHCRTGMHPLEKGRR